MSGTAQDVGWVARTPLRPLFSSVDKADLPGSLGRVAGYPSLLERTPLVNGHIGFLTALLGAKWSDPDERASTYLERALIDLHIAVLAARRVPLAVSDGEALRVRMERFVQDNLTDPTLGPQAVADAMGVSLRSAHHVFNRDGRTLAA